MRILVSGSTGLIGSAVVSSLAGAGHEVLRLVRSQPKPDAPEVAWDPRAGTLDAVALEGVPARIANMAERWSES